MEQKAAPSCSSGPLSPHRRTLTSCHELCLFRELGMGNQWAVRIGSTTGARWFRYYASHRAFPDLLPALFPSLSAQQKKQRYPGGGIPLCCEEGVDLLHEQHFPISRQRPVFIGDEPFQFVHHLPYGVHGRNDVISHVVSLFTNGISTQLGILVV